MILRTSRNCSAACKYWPSTQEKRAFPSEHPHHCYVKNVSAVRVKAQSQVNMDAGYGMTHATRQWTVCKASAGFARNCDSGSYFSKPPIIRHKRQLFMTNPAHHFTTRFLQILEQHCKSQFHCKPAFMLYSNWTFNTVLRFDQHDGGLQILHGSKVIKDSPLEEN